MRICGWPSTQECDDEPISLHKHYDQPDAFEHGLIITAAHVDNLMYTGRPLISSDLVVNFNVTTKENGCN
jgi:hypothetical protein